MKKETKKEPKKKVVKPMVRINTRIRLDQSKFIKKRAKAFNLTEGDVLRAIIDTFMSTDTYLPTKLK